MKKPEDLSRIPKEVEEFNLEEEKQLLFSNEWVKFSKSYKKFQKSAFQSPLPFDPRSNAIHWGFAVGRLCREIAFGYCWMNAYAKYYREQMSPDAQPANVDFHVSYFADNSITRIASCRDKIALMVWAYYCPFNPEKKTEVLDYAKVLDRLKHPLRFGLSLKDCKRFLQQLEKLQDSDIIRMVHYRHLKIHRMEPRIEIYGAQPHHGLSYMFSLYEKDEIAKWERELEKQYPNDEHRKRIANNCHINGVLFDRRKIESSIWSYEEVQQKLYRCLTRLLVVTAECFDLLRSRSPLKKKKRTGV
jgi:hypothetical protein